MDILAAVIYNFESIRKKKQRKKVEFLDVYIDWESEENEEKKYT